MTIEMLRIIIETIIAIGAIALAFGYLWSQFRKGNKSYGKESTDDATRLIAILQGTVTELEKKITVQSLLLSDNTSRILALETQNTAYEKVFQGRDEQTQEFMKQGFGAIKASNEIIPLIKSTHDLVEANAKSSEKLYKTMEKHIEMMGKLPIFNLSQTTEGKNV